MLPNVLVRKKDLTPYEDIVDPHLIGRIHDLAETLKGVRGRNLRPAQIVLYEELEHR